MVIAIFESSEEPGLFPYPPNYSSGNFTWQSPYFITSTALITFILVAGIGRFLLTKDYLSGPRLAPNAIILGGPQAFRAASALTKLILVLCFIVITTFVGDAAVIVVRALVNSHWTSSVLAYYTFVSVTAWALLLATATDETRKFLQWSWVQYTFWYVSALTETAIAWMWAMGILKPRDGTIFSNYDYILLGLFITRYITVLSTAALALLHMFTNRKTVDDASAPLLGSSTTGYGTTNGSASGTANGSATGAAVSEKQVSGVQYFFSKMRKLLPFMWPKHSKKLQIYVGLCFVILIIGRIVNFLTPLQFGIVVESLENVINGGERWQVWKAILLYTALKVLQGGTGLLQSVQSYLWFPINQYTTREISLEMFGHLHNLSLQFHIGRKTGEVLRVMDRGTSSIVQLLSQILLSIFPTLLDIGVAVIFFAIRFNFSFGLIVFTTMAVYIYVTIAITEWRTKFRRAMIEADNDVRTKAVDSLLNFETVKYYGAEDFELNRYSEAVAKYQKADWKTLSSLTLLNLTQSVVITLGLLAGNLLCAYEVTRGNMSLKEFITFNTYIMQLYTPLNFFGTYYRMIQQNFVDMEKMLDLFEQEQTVQDMPNATELTVTQGHVVFENVSFAYDERQPALRNISFTIPQGATVALVGPSGGGKSTILRLLFRFYDTQSGRILIDGQDISSVKQVSLRKAIGVVPQDTVLFNDTILYNIHYGRIDAPEDDVMKAAAAAQIHDRILTFPDGYDTKVGERGLRLSGGEKQRVAIARTILKNPPIILLDEATSALDTTTERHIQRALAEMTHGRTTLVIAHRLSTIVNADLILVIKDGQVVESGTHDELINHAISTGEEGVYYEMWQKQLKDENTEATANNSEVSSTNGEPSDKGPSVEEAAVNKPNAVDEAVAAAEPDQPEAPNTPDGSDIQRSPSLENSTDSLNTPSEEAQTNSDELAKETEVVNTPAGQGSKSKKKKKKKGKKN
ncbi:hypothetical protein INT43_008954 [Umbelopsis isabellina]|uniref:Uncharacterized protein n=1 Tax=Mortierella isabellina TaxID=91625 RepID=A0A8H7UD95_MORIS|nr:hypothetical protein INT43_008954 [Umbelopsis isabellina]